VTTTETLDAESRLTGSSLTIAMADGSVRTVQYDAADRAVGSSTTTVAGTVTTTLLDDAVGAAIGSRVTTSDGAGSSGTIVYDAAGNVSASSRVEVLAPGYGAYHPVRRVRCAGRRVHDGRGCCRQDHDLQLRCRRKADRQRGRDAEMQLTAEIREGNRTALQYLLSPVLEAVHDSARER